MMTTTHLHLCIKELLHNGIGAHFAIRFGYPGNYTDYYSGGDPAVNEHTLFDMASVTKIAATTPLVLMAFEDGALTPDTPVSDFFACPADKKELKIRHLLTHTMGFGHKSLNKPEINYANVAEAILQIPCDVPIGTQVMYSCPGYILLGKILEKIYEKPLDVLYRTKIAIPLGMDQSGFGRRSGDVVNANNAPNEAGLVNDYNCRHLGGVAGNAGLFSSLHDMTLYVQMLLRGGSPLLHPETLSAATRNYTEGLGAGRGYGFVYVDEKYPQTGTLFDIGSIGHCGHTGQSVFLNRETGFYTIILSDMTKCVHNNYSFVMAAREKIHNAINADMNSDS